MLGGKSAIGFSPPAPSIIAMSAHVMPREYHMANRFLNLGLRFQISFARFAHALKESSSFAFYLAL